MTCSFFPPCVTLMVWNDETSGHTGCPHYQVIHNGHCTKSEFNPNTCPRLFCPVAHTVPSLPTNRVWFLPQAACTIFLPFGVPKSVGFTKRGAFSEMHSTLGT